MATESDGSTGGSAVYGRAPPPKVALPQRGIVLGLAWSGIEGAGNQIVAAKGECSKGKPKLTQVWRPFQDAPGRRDVREQFPTWLEEEFFPPRPDFSEASEAFKGQLGKDRLRFADCYRAAVFPPSHLRLYRQTFFGLLTVARLSDVAFVPWEPPKANRPVLAEVRPEHVARELCGACAYRDDARDGVNRSGVRAAVLRTMRTAAGLEFEMELAAKVVEDEKGLVLDAVLSAVGAAAAQEENFQGVPSNVPRSEGWIYSVREEPWRNV